MEHWSGVCGAFCVKSFYKNGDSDAIVERLKSIVDFFGILDTHSVNIIRVIYQSSISQYLPNGYSGLQKTDNRFSD